MRERQRHRQNSHASVAIRFMQVPFSMVGFNPNLSMSGHRRDAYKLAGKRDHRGPRTLMYHDN
jgi:hypothetical protein